MFPAARPLEAARSDAQLLGRLVAAGFPAERCAHPEPVSTHEGQAVLVTELAAGKAPSASWRTFRLLGELLGRLHSLPDDPAVTGRPGGAWHHLALECGPREELAAAASLLQDARPRVAPAQRDLHAALSDALAGGDDCHDLPWAVIHADFVPVNLVATQRGDVTVVDWTGAGRGPRLWSLAWLLWAAGARSMSCVEAVVAGYQSRLSLEESELDRLAGAIGTRPVVLACWEFATGRQPLAEVADRVRAVPAGAVAIAARARAAFGAPPVVRNS